jgi:hypothetical protein
LRKKTEEEEDKEEDKGALPLGENGAEADSKEVSLEPKEVEAPR